jgi:phospholipid/cholesterol/gamma-HCH transport system permease protein
MEGGFLVLDGLAALGAQTRGFLRTGGQVLRFSVDVVAHGMWPPVPLGPTLGHAWDLVRRCLLPVTLVVVPMGALISLQGAAMIQNFGVERLLAPMVGLTVVRELAPGFSALMVAMQAGTALAAQVAVMRVRDELDAYEVMGVDPLRHVVAPRLVAAALVTPLLTTLSMALAVLGSWSVAVLARGFAARAFLDACLESVAPWDLWAAFIKAVVFGVLLSSLSCFEGFTAERSAAGVGRAANRSVVGAMVAILLANYVLNSVLFAGVAQRG